MKAGFAYCAAGIGMVLLLLIGSLSGSPARADFEDGMASFAKGDLSVALGEFTRSAKDNDPRGQHALGMLYLRGKGVSRDAVQAFEWFLKAADQGHVSAMLQIGKLRQAGKAVDHDLVAAHRWFSIAAAHGHPAGEKSRDKLDGNLNDDQIAQSQAETESWMEAHYDDVDVDRRETFLQELKRLRELSNSRNTNRGR